MVNLRASYELLQEKSDDYIHPSCLYASTSDSPACFPCDNTSINIILRFLPNAYSVGEVIVPTGYRQRLVFNSNHGIYRWLTSRTVGDWILQVPVYQAYVISNHCSCPQPNFY